jgi:hypothetical protein
MVRDSLRQECLEGGGRFETDLAVKAGMLGYVGLLHLQSRAWYLPESQAYIHAGEVMQRADNM